jgi:hypothetical protein
MIEIKEFVYLVWFEPDYASEYPESYPSLQGVWGEYNDIPQLFKDEDDYDVVKEIVK